MSENLDIFGKCPNGLNLLQGVPGHTKLEVGRPFPPTEFRGGCLSNVLIIFSEKPYENKDILVRRGRVPKFL